MKANKYKSVWISFIQFKACDGENFNDLIDVGEDEYNLPYLGAWANVLVNSTGIRGVSKIIEDGLRELKFQLVFIQKVENTAMLVEESELKIDVVDEIDYMLQKGYKFMISDRIFPYTDTED